MHTRAYFFKIKDEIVKQLHTAKVSVFVAVAWLTDEDLIRELSKLSSTGVKVTVVMSNSDQNFLHPERFKSFLNNGAELFVCNAIFMHHKFCIIDDHGLINGSYNWSYNARGSEENIIIHRVEANDAPAQTLLKQFLFRFQNIIITLPIFETKSLVI